jgi:hypothetical protein
LVCNFRQRGRKFCSRLFRFTCVTFLNFIMSIGTTASARCKALDSIFTTSGTCQVSVRSYTPHSMSQNPPDKCIMYHIWDRGFDSSRGIDTWTWFSVLFYEGLISQQESTVAYLSNYFKNINRDHCLNRAKAR